jgi:hypothetical protein
MSCGCCIGSAIKTAIAMQYLSQPNANKAALQIIQKITQLFMIIACLSMGSGKSDDEHLDLVLSK